MAEIILFDLKVVLSWLFCCQSVSGRMYIHVCLLRGTFHGVVFKNRTVGVGKEEIGKQSVKFR